jgi:hypothetical protein
MYSPVRSGVNVGVRVVGSLMVVPLSCGRLVGNRNLEAVKS